MKQNVQKFDLNLASGFFSLRDSMCYDSGWVVGSARIVTNNVEYKITIATQGHVKVFYKGDMYKCASQMPQELIDKLYDGTAYDNGDLECVENNWWEVMVYKNGEYVDYLGGYMDCTPSDFKDKEDLKNYLLETIKQD